MESTAYLKTKKNKTKEIIETTKEKMMRKERKGMR